MYYVVKSTQETDVRGNAMTSKTTGIPVQTGTARSVADLMSLAHARDLNDTSRLDYVFVEDSGSLVQSIRHSM